MKKYPKCSPYDLRALENWLAQLAAEGFELTEEWQKFREGEKREKQFYIEPAEKDEPPAQTLRASRALMGWEYVCPMNKGAFYVWRSLDATASGPRAREMTGTWADKRLGRELLWWCLGQTTGAAGLAIFTVLQLWMRHNWLMPVWWLLTDVSAQMSVLLLLLGTICGFWATRRDYLALRRLRRDVRAGERQEAVAQHTAWYTAMRVLPVVVSLLLLLPLIHTEGKTEPDEWRFLAAEALGGNADERCADVENTYLCDRIVVKEGGFAGWSGPREQMECATQLEVYRLRFGIFSQALTEEMTRYFELTREEDLAGAETYYSARDGVQRALLRRDGTVLLYRTNAPDDLRGHVGEFAALLEAYR